MNIMFNNYCNLHCKYCFASLEPKKRIDISDENLKYYIEFCKTSNFRHLRILGGEPTLHPKFTEHLYNAVNDSFFQGVRLFSNAINLNKEMAQILAHPKGSVLVNLNHPDDIGEKLYEKTLENLAWLIRFYMDKHIRPAITLGINIYSPDFDYDYILEATKLFHLERIRYSITVPNDHEKKIDRAYYQSFVPRLVEFLTECSKNNIMTTSDCNTAPKCVYSHDQIIELLYGRHNILHKEICSPVMDVRPDLQVSRCFAFEDKIMVNLKDFKNYREINDFFRSKVDVHRFELPTYSDCPECQWFQKKRCQGGCLAYKGIQIT